MRNIDKREGEREIERSAHQLCSSPPCFSLVHAVSSSVSRIIAPYRMHLRTTTSIPCYPHDAKEGDDGDDLSRDKMIQQSKPKLPKKKSGKKKAAPKMKTEANK